MEEHDCHQTTDDAQGTRRSSRLAPDAGSRSRRPIRRGFVDHSEVRAVFGLRTAEVLLGLDPLSSRRVRDADLCAIDLHSEHNGVSSVAGGDSNRWRILEKRRACTSTSMVRNGRNLPRSRMDCAARGAFVEAASWHISPRLASTGERRVDNDDSS